MWKQGTAKLSKKNWEEWRKWWKVVFHEQNVMHLVVEKTRNAEKEAKATSFLPREQKSWAPGQKALSVYTSLPLLTCNIPNLVFTKQ